MIPTLFQSLIGAPFYGLPPAVRALHGVRGGARYVGVATVQRARNPLAAVCGWVAGLPPAKRDVPVTVDFECAPGAETWSRRFGAVPMRSRLQAKGRLLDERLGALRFRFSLHVFDAAIHWRVERVRVFGFVPLPARAFSRVRCRESEVDGRYTFEVEAKLPLVGTLIRYDGWLEAE